MRLRSIIPLLASIVLGASPAFAGSSTSAGFVKDISSWNDGRALFNHTGTRNDTIACQNAQLPKAWEINAGTTAGQAQMSLLLTAYLQHKQVVVIGTDSCEPISGLETVLLVYFADAP